MDESPRVPGESQAINLPPKESIVRSPSESIVRSPQDCTKRNTLKTT